MPDSNTPWTPDEAFWDEAWADMDTRLEHKRRKRLLLPLLVLLALLTAGTLVLWPLGTPDKPTPAPALAATAAAPEAAPDLLDSHTPAGRLADATGTDQPAVAPAAGTGSPARISAAAAAPAPAAPDLSPPTPNETPEVTTAKPVNPNPATATKALPTLPPAPPTFDYTFGFDPEYVEYKSFTPLPIAQRFTLESGATAYPSSYLPGGYAQLTRQFRGPGRWIMPVSLRYDYGRRWVTTHGFEDPQELLNPTAPANNFISAQARDVFHQPREVHTHTLGVRGGLGRRITPRITLAGGLEASYLLGGAGPAYAVSDSSGVVTVTVTEERFRQGNFGGGGQMDMAAGGGGNPRTAILNPMLNRWGASVWLQAHYRLAGKLHLSLGTSRQLSPVYSGGEVKVERQRLELGLRWGG